VSVTRHRDGVRPSGASRRLEEDTASTGNGLAAPDSRACTYRYAVAGWGVGELATRDGLLVAHAFPSPRRRLEAQRAASPPGGPPQGGASTPEVTVEPEPSRECDAFVPDLCRRFAAHLEGTRVSYDDVPIDEDGLTPFQRELQAAARSVSWGEVVTYGGLAGMAGRPRAARAAGSFCAKNRISLVVPCHRIVAAGKDEPFGIGGYGPSGLRLKRRLLTLEGTLL
jgi:methylated-DNA-[protein]-cysteine S-methyltransferase